MSSLQLNLSPSKSNALIVGPIAFDSVITPQGTRDRVLGGSGAYGALASSYFAPTKIVAVVGDDFDHSDTERFTNRGIDIQGIEKKSGRTFYWKGKYHDDFNVRETLDLQLNVFENFSPILPKNFDTIPFVFLGNIDPDVQSNLFSKLKNNPFVVLDTIDFWIRNKKSTLLNLIQKISLLVINDHEARLLTGDNNTVSAGHSLLKSTSGSVIIKKGEYGSMLFHKDGIFSLPAYPISYVVDPTGAGDTYTGAIIGYLAATQDTSFRNIKHAMIYGTVIGSLTVQAFSFEGIESAGLQTIQQRHNELIQMISL